MTWHGATIGTSLILTALGIIGVASVFAESCDPSIEAWLWAQDAECAPHMIEVATHILLHGEPDDYEVFGIENIRDDRYEIDVRHHKGECSLPDWPEYVSADEYDWYETAQSAPAGNHTTTNSTAQNSTDILPTITLTRYDITTTDRPVYQNQTIQTWNNTAHGLPRPEVPVHMAYYVGGGGVGGEGLHILDPCEIDMERIYHITAEPYELERFISYRDIQQRAHEL